MKDLIIKENEPYVSSITIAERLGVKPRHTFRLIQKYKSDIEDLGVLRFENAKGQNGRPQRFVFLNEEQSIFILTLSKNTQSVVKLKKDLSLQFVACRKYLMSKQQTRLTGKEKRRDLTDSIKKLVVLANQSGSKNANRYYTSFTKMIYQLMFNLKNVPENFRDTLDEKSLTKLQYYECQVAQWLDDAIQFCMDYHEPYHAVKLRLKALVDVIGIVNFPNRLSE